MWRGREHRQHLYYVYMRRKVSRRRGVDRVSPCLPLVIHEPAALRARHEVIRCRARVRAERLHLPRGLVVLEPAAVPLLRVKHDRHYARVGHQMLRPRVIVAEAHKAGESARALSTRQPLDEAAAATTPELLGAWQWKPEVDGSRPNELTPADPSSP